MKNFDQEMWQDFTIEVQENLEEFEPNLLLLEQQPDDASILNDCFRNMHSIKGAANYMGLVRIAALAHAVENLFDQARQGARQLGQDAFDLMFRCVDRFKELLDDVAENHKETLDTQDLIDQIKAVTDLGHVPENVSEDKADPLEPHDESQEDQELLNIFAQEMKSLFDQITRLSRSGDAEPATLEQVLHDMERVANYIGKDRLHASVQAIREELSGHAADESLGEEFLKEFLAKLRDALSQEIELHDELGPAVNSAAASIEEDTELYSIFLDFFREVGSPLARIPENIDEKWMADCQEAVARLRTSANYMDYMEVVHLLEEWEECMAEQLSGSVDLDRNVFVGLWERLCDRLPNLEQMFDSLEAEERPESGTIPSEEAEGGEDQTSLGLESLEDFDSAIDTMFEDGDIQESVLEASASADKSTSDPAAGTGFAPAPENFPEISQVSQPDQPQKDQSAGRSQLVRVNLEKVENLLEDVAELVVLRSSMAQSTTMLKGLYSKWQDLRRMPVQELKPLKEILLDFTENVAALERVVQQLQDGVMRMRMLPVSSLFNRYPRMVRDLCQKLGKDVELSLRGTETALDKQVIEQLADPLQHIVRNALDHGIEPGAERTRKGKPAKGHLSIAASQEGNFVIISISDDGRGLDRDQIVKKAVSSGVITAEALRDLSEEQIWNLVFLPGISTAGSVSDISGRGVGLDVVKRNIEKIGGAVVVRSSRGKGTTFILRIPLTLAIIKGLTVMVGTQAMVIPISAVYETFRLSPGEVSQVEGFEIISRRQETLPLIRLGRIFRGTGAPENPEKFFAVRVRLGELDACLGVDGLVGQQEVVIKPLAEYLMDQPGFAGATILGDGSIGLILDLPAVLEKSKGFIHKRQQLLERAALGISHSEAPMLH